MKTFMILLILIISCDSNVLDPNASNNGRQLNAYNIKLRIHNNTSFDLENISSNNTDFGEVLSTNYSDYIGFSIIHTYPEISAIAFGKNVSYPGVVANDPMYEKGWYTIKVSNVDTTNNTIFATLIKDSN